MVIPLRAEENRAKAGSMKFDRDSSTPHAMQKAQGMLRSE